MASYKEAIIALNKCIELDNSQLLPWFELVICYLRIENYQDARKTVNKALQLFESESIYMLSILTALVANNNTAIDEIIRYSKFATAKNILVTQEKLTQISIPLVITNDILAFPKLKQLLDTLFDHGLKERFETSLITALINKLMDTDNHAHLSKVGKQLNQSSISDETKVLWNKYLKAGIEYYGNNNERALYELTKEERELFLKFTNPEEVSGEDWSVVLAKVGRWAPSHLFKQSIEVTRAREAQVVAYLFDGHVSGEQ